jgi:hypothetical protein
LVTLPAIETGIILPEADASITTDPNDSIVGQ